VTSQPMGVAARELGVNIQRSCLSLQTTAEDSIVPVSTGRKSNNSLSSTFFSLDDFEAPRQRKKRLDEEKEAIQLSDFQSTTAAYNSVERLISESESSARDALKATEFAVGMKSLGSCKDTESEHPGDESLLSTSLSLAASKANLDSTAPPTGKEIERKPTATAADRIKSRTSFPSSVSAYAVAAADAVVPPSEIVFFGEKQYNKYFIFWQVVVPTTYFRCSSFNVNIKVNSISFLFYIISCLHVLPCPLMLMYLSRS